MIQIQSQEDKGERRLVFSQKTGEWFTNATATSLVIKNHTTCCAQPKGIIGQDLQEYMSNEGKLIELIECSF
jgi:hypothetical protein